MKDPLFCTSENSGFFAALRMTVVESLLRAVMLSDEVGKRAAQLDGASERVAIIRNIGFSFKGSKEDVWRQ
jgi:hypothetical protein